MVDAELTPEVPEQTAEAATPSQAPHEHVDVIDSAEGFAAAVAAIAAGHGPVAVDAERASGYRYSQRAYLIQLYRRGAGTFLFDPIPLGDMSALDEVIADEEWILHAASQDLTCLREVGLEPRRLFDTELAARLAGLPRVGLGAVVEELLGIHLAKEHSAADWSTRPLPQPWLVYAALDVELLVDVREKLGEVLEAQGKIRAAEEEFDAVLKRDLVPVRAEPWRRLGGLHTVRSPRGLAVARALWEARDAYAREIDTAPGRLVPDLSLSAAARANPESKRDLAALKEFTGRASRSQIDRWWEAIEAGRADENLPSTRVPGDGLPPPRAWAEKNPDADRRLKIARAVVQLLAERAAMPPENLLTPDTLRRVAWAPPTPITVEAVGAALHELGARPWQVDATAQGITAAFVEADQTPEEPSEPES